MGVNVTQSPYRFSQQVLISPGVMMWLTRIIIAAMLSVNAVGTVANIINITVFVKMRFADSTTVSLLALAISDMLSLITSFWTAVCHVPQFSQSGIPFRSKEIHLITGSYFHAAFTNGWITAFVSVERCIAVTFPLKAKTWITPTRSVIFIAAIFTVCLIPALGIYSRYTFKWKFYQDVNKTLLGVDYINTPVAIRFDIFSRLSYGIIFPFSSFMIVVVCTVILSIRLKRSLDWRRRAAIGIKNNLGNQHVAGRSLNTNYTQNVKEVRIIKIVTTIAIVFIACFIPTMGSYMIGLFLPEFKLNGNYHDVWVIVGSTSFIFEAINASVNIIMYYRLSTPYRRVFDHMFGLQ